MEVKKSQRNIWFQPCTIPEAMSAAEPARAPRSNPNAAGSGSPSELPSASSPEWNRRGDLGPDHPDPDERAWSPAGLLVGPLPALPARRASRCQVQRSPSILPAVPRARPANPAPDRGPAPRSPAPRARGAFPGTPGDTRVRPRPLRSQEAAAMSLGRDTDRGGRVLPRAAAGALRRRAGPMAAFCLTPTKELFDRNCWGRLQAPPSLAQAVGAARRSKRTRSMT